MIRKRILVFLLFCFWQVVVNPVQSSDLRQEYVTTTPVLVDGILYVASSMYPDRRGHLRAIDILDIFPEYFLDIFQNIAFFRVPRPELVCSGTYRYHHGVSPGKGVGPDRLVVGLGRPYIVERLGFPKKHSPIDNHVYPGGVVIPLLHRLIADR